MELKIQHIGLCVKNIDEYVAKMDKVFGCKEVKNRLHIPQAGQTSALVEMGNGNYFELMEPMGEEGVVPKFLATKGEGFHHIGVYCDDPVALGKQLVENGIKILGDPASGGFFVAPKSAGGVLYEISSTKDLEREV